MNDWPLMKCYSLAVMGIVALLLPIHAQQDVPLLRPEERKAVDAQIVDFNQAIAPVLKEAGESTVRVWYGSKKLLTYGTVIGDGTEILTKWSEVVPGRRDLIVQAADESVRQATIQRVYRDEDIAVLKFTGVPLKPVKWVDKKLELGGFLAAAQPAGRLAGFGVVSVLARSLRETDQAFLGVVSVLNDDGIGVKIRQITENSGAEDAGLKPGDVILKSGDRNISGLLELQNSLVGVEPGDTIELLVKRSGQTKKVKVTLGNRPELQSFRGDRLQKMEQMGTKISKIRDSFSNAVQTDMALEPNQVGGPVVGLNGDVVGVTVARADRTRSFIVPSATIQNLLQGEGTDPSFAQLPRNDKRSQAMRGGGTQPPPRRAPSPERMQQHLDEMKQLMEFMQDEMDTLRRGR